MNSNAPSRSGCPTCAESTVSDLIDSGHYRLAGDVDPYAVATEVDGRPGSCVDCGAALIIDPALYGVPSRAARAA